MRISSLARELHHESITQLAGFCSVLHHDQTSSGASSLAFLPWQAGFARDMLYFLNRKYMHQRQHVRNTRYSCQRNKKIDTQILLLKEIVQIQYFSLHICDTYI